MWQTCVEAAPILQCGFANSLPNQIQSYCCMSGWWLQVLPDNLIPWTFQMQNSIKWKISLLPKKIGNFVPKFCFTINAEVPILKVALLLVPKAMWIDLLPFKFGLLSHSCISFLPFTKQQHSWILYCSIHFFTLTSNRV